MLSTSTLFNVNNILNELRFCQAVSKRKKYSNSKKSFKDTIMLANKCKLEQNY